MDQADTLRKLMRERFPDEDGKPGTEAASAAVPVVTIASGKGGVGKSCLVANLGASLARSGLRVLLVDGDLGLANLDIMLGVRTRATLEQVMSGEATPREALLGLEPNLWLIPSASGLMELRRADLGTRERALSFLDGLPWEMDMILVDAGAGIHADVLSLHHATYHSLVVTTPEPTALTDAYGLIKCLRRASGISRFSLVVNQVADGAEARKAYLGIRDVAARFLPDIRVEYLGHWSHDEKVTQSVMKRKILLDLDPGSASVPSLELLAKHLRLRCLGSARGDTATGRVREPGFLEARPRSGHRRSARGGQGGQGAQGGQDAQGSQGAPGATGAQVGQGATGAPGAKMAGFWRTLLRGDYGVTKHEA